MNASLHRLRLLRLLALSALGLLVFPAPGDAQTAESGFNAFRLIRTRNIFDPERRPIQSGTVAQRPQAAPPPRSNYVSLTGTMTTTGKKLAFFAGSAAEYNRVIGLQEVIAGYTIADILPTQVKLERDGKPTVVNVGQQIPLAASGTPPAAPIATPPSGADTPPQGAGTPPESATPPTGTPADSPASTSSPPTTDKSEVLRRMMEARQKELSR